MEKEMIVIPIEEYKKLLESAVRLSIFVDFVNQSKYSIDRKDCSLYLGFELDDKEV